MYTATNKTEFQSLAYMLYINKYIHIYIHILTHYCANAQVIVFCIEVNTI